MIFSIIAAPLLLLAAAQAPLTGATDCESYSYMYTLQPPEDIVCSPYIRGILNLTCAVSGDMVEDIHWYFRPPGGSSSQSVVLSNSSQVTITRSEFEGDYSVVMVMVGLSAENEGFYWCQGLVRHRDHTLELSQSAEFELQPPSQYIMFSCPIKALKSSEVRCAAVIPLPVVSSSPTPFPSLTATFPDILLPSEESSTVELNQTSTVPSHTPTTTHISPTSQPTVTDNTISGPTTDPPPSSDSKTDSTTVTPQTPLTQGTIQLSDIILYAILGLLGCLVVLVFTLSVVISILCCKKRHRGSEGKEAPYDQFSTGSEAPPGTMTLKSLETFPLAPPLPPPYRLPLHRSNSGTITSSSSGVYDEIPPHHEGRFPLYQEIPVVPGERTADNNNSTLNTTGPSCAPPRAGDNINAGELPALPQARCEHPYDLPDQPGPSSHSHSHQNPSPHSSSNPKTPSSTHQQQLQHHDQQDEQNGYDALQKVGVVLTVADHTDSRSSIGDSSDFTNSNLQATPPPEEEGVVFSSLTGTSCTVTLEVETPPELVLDMATLEEEEEEGAESSGSTLPAIPEHQYHILEDNHQGCTRVRHNGVHEVGDSSEPRPPQILYHLSLSEDEGYDRLVGPPHIYHILQKSPSLIRPRFREVSPVSGYHHLDTRMDSGARTSGSTSSKQHHQQHVRLHAPSIDSDSPHSEESSMVSGSEIFDDPQYNFSPKRNFGGSGGQQKKPPPQRNSHSGQVTTLERKKAGKGAVNLSKYRGDYERDPMYMQKLSDPAASKEAADHVNVCLLMNSGSNKSASLPDITHTYQSLQALTRDPLRNYEMLHRRRLDVNPTNV